MKIALDYDPITGQISHNGTNLYMYSGLESLEVKEAEVNITELVKLGVTADEIIKMKNHGVL